MPSVGSVVTALMLITSTAAHFTVQHPPTIKPFDDENEGQAPCGGYIPDPTSLNTTDFHVDGDYIATIMTHTQATWLYRITTDLTAGGNWSQAYPNVKQNGAGRYCQTQVTISHDFIGQTAILGLVADAPDGLLYECSAVRFVEGSVTPPSGEGCMNATGVSGDYSPDSALSSQLGNPSIPPTPDERSDTSAGVLSKSDTFHGLGAFVTVGLMAVMGAAMMV